MDDATRDWLLAHHKESYRFQAERSDKIRDRISFLVTPFTVLGSGILYALSNYRHGWSGIHSALFYVPVILATVLFVLALGMALYCLGKGFKYQSIPQPRGLQQDVESIAAYATAIAPRPFDVLGHVKTVMMRRYCEAADHNLNVNFRRTNLVLRATQLGILSFILLLLALPAFFGNNLQPSRTGTTIHIYEHVIHHGPRRISEYRDDATRQGYRARGQTPSHPDDACRAADDSA
jgi:hypothetical protein